MFFEGQKRQGLSKRMRAIPAVLASWTLLLACSALWAQYAGSLQGRVADPSGAVVPGATVLVELEPNGPSRTAATNGQGIYRIGGLPPGLYKITVKAQGFAPSLKAGVALSASAGHALTLDIHLAIASEVQNVEVNAGASPLQVAPQENASAVVIAGANLEALSNDPDELQNQISALAGPAVGAGGADIYIDGFIGGDMPPKSAIREIRVNANPFTAENDRLGYGRVDIFTKPGSAAFHGDVSAEYNDSRMNALSTFLTASGQTPPSYHTWLSNADLGGPLGKRASFYFAVERRNINRDNLVNTDILDSNLNVQPYVAYVSNPRVLTSIAPRFDFQLSPGNTLTARYDYFEIGESNDGVDTQSLPSQAYNAERHHHNLQIFDSQVVNAHTVNETRFQYLHFHNSEIPQNNSPTIDVLGAFMGGGDSSGLYDRFETHYELQNYTTMTLHRHLLRFGGFLLDLPRSENTNANFNGTFTFNSLADYQQTEQGLRNGLTMPQIQAAGYGPSQFNVTAGKLSAAINRLDGALFLNDDWSVTPHFTASFGLRFESENVISDHADWAPRLGFSWGLGHGANTKTVVRGGFGIFYQRFDDDQMIIAERANGQNQLTYIVNQPAFFPTPPPLAFLSASNASAPTVYSIAPNLQSPRDVDIALSIERQIAPNATLSLTCLNSRGLHQFLSNDINAPLPGTYTPADPTSGARPLGTAAGNIYEYESAGDYRQTQLIANFHASASKLSLFGYYVFNDAHSDTTGVDSFPANPWDIHADYGRAAFDIRNRAVIGGSYAMPLGFRLSSMMMANSGLPFSIMLGQDLYGTGIHNSRPAPANASTPPADLVVTQYGSFNIAPGPGDEPVPPNTATAPASFMLNFRLNRTFGFGGEGKGKHGGEDGAPSGGSDHSNRGLGGRGLSGSGGGATLGGATGQRYALTLSVSALNALNNVNLAPPINVIGSPLFGQSIALAGGAFSAQVGNPVANRLVSVSASFSF